MKFDITGADAKTGAERSVQVEAPSEKAALAVAKSRGVFPYRIAEVHEEPVFELIEPPIAGSIVADGEQDSDDQVRCPRCQSASLSVNKKGFGVGKAAIGTILLGPIGLVGGLIGANKLEITCLKCGHGFKPGEGHNAPITTVAGNAQGQPSPSSAGCIVVLLASAIASSLLIAIIAFIASSEPLPPNAPNPSEPSPSISTTASNLSSTGRTASYSVIAAARWFSTRATIACG